MENASNGVPLVDTPASRLGVACCNYRRQLDEDLIVPKMKWLNVPISPLQIFQEGSSMLQLELLCFD